MLLKLDGKIAFAPKGNSSQAWYTDVHNSITAFFKCLIMKDKNTNPFWVIRYSTFELLPSVKPLLP